MQTAARSFPLPPSPLARHDASRDVCTFAFRTLLGTRPPVHSFAQGLWICRYSPKTSARSSSGEGYECSLAMTHATRPMPRTTSTSRKCREHFTKNVSWLPPGKWHVSSIFSPTNILQALQKRHSTCRSRPSGNPGTSTKGCREVRGVPWHEHGDGQGRRTPGAPQQAAEGLTLINTFLRAEQLLITGDGWFNWIVQGFGGMVAMIFDLKPSRS
ncbi:uncharacterized protein LOC120698807 isoform X1 [Panicum virgatum]|uniref:uncharacterized protein LOC120698807 isoform X1 n=1 Tax=Panicum virgatum TaxID=38727 RepID=UPI0019D5267F|nr:uncharacterized protein LOC120698807 isoform X1 [Panicum virgatum]XP_039838491.1 uncharacterized protein LOC120698807 isoform X1 [Panicum virgatum]